MQCPNCHTDVPANARFCGVCGQTLNAAGTHISAKGFGYSY